MSYGAKIIHGGATLEIKKNLRDYFLYFLKLQHENDKVQAKSTPSMVYWIKQI